MTDITTSVTKPSFPAAPALGGTACRMALVPAAQLRQGQPQPPTTNQKEAGP